MLELAKILVQTLSSGLRLSFELHALVAQWIERRFPKPCVGGSTPLGGTIKIPSHKESPYDFFCIMRPAFQ